jgi:hypothetical protein
MSNGQRAALTFSAGSGGTALAGTYSVTVTNANNFTVTSPVSVTITGSPSATRSNFMRGSGNITSILDYAVGTYQINISSSLPNSNYAVCATGSSPGAGAGAVFVYETLLTDNTRWSSIGSILITSTNSSMTAIDSPCISVIAVG